MSEVGVQYAMRALPARLQGDANVANHLFRLPRELLHRPGLITATWHRNGELKRECIWTFSDLQQRVLQCMAWLRQQGLEPGDRVLLMVRPGMELITLCFALFRLGVVPIVIDPGMGLGKFKRAVAQSAPVGLIGIPLAHCVSRLFPKSFASIEKRIVVQPRSLLAQLDRAGSLQTQDLGVTQSTDAAAVLFTSGSTGAPKGVCYEHGMFDAQIRLLREQLNIEPGEVDLPMLPIFALFNPAMGMTTVLPEINPGRPASVDPVKIVAAIQRYQVTNSFGSPVLWRKIGDHCERQQIQFPQLRRILVAGAAAPTQLYRQYERILPQGQLISPYGATECLPVSLISGQEVLSGTAALTDRGAGICVGKPLEAVTVRLAPLDGRPVDLALKPKPGEVGEIVVNGPSVTREYYQLPEATAGAKILDAGKVWHRMGDVGYFDEQGRLWFCGRKIEAIHLQDGNDLFTEQVEGPFLTHPQVKRCALVDAAKPHLGDAHRIALVVQPVEGSWPRSRGARFAFAAMLAEHLRSNGLHTPVQVVYFLRSLPVDVRHNAKIHRLTLRRTIQKQEPIPFHASH